MITALDSSVLLDIITNSSTHADLSEQCLRKARQEGALIVCECVIAEIRPALASGDFQEFLGDWQLEYIPLSREGAVLAGEQFAGYLQRGGRARRVLPDFLIGAHALLQADRLLARDRGYMRDYFSQLTLWQPDSQP